LHFLASECEIEQTLNAGLAVYLEKMKTIY